MTVGGPVSTYTYSCMCVCVYACVYLYLSCSPLLVNSTLFFSLLSCGVYQQTNKRSHANTNWTNLFVNSWLLPVFFLRHSRVPADCRVVDSVELSVDESALTGENNPVEKVGEGISIGMAPTLTHQRNMVFAGTLTSTGRGRAIVVAVGKATEFGKVATELAEVTTNKSPLQLKIDELGQRLAALSSVAIALIGLSGWLLGRPFLETVTIAVSLAVAAIPEGLPICVTVTLALGVLRMARMNAIVKKLPVVESLGCATVVASDKTGTLTQNEMTVRAVFSLAFPNTNFRLTGVGYDTRKGGLVQVFDGNESHPRKITADTAEFRALEPIFHASSICNNASLAGSTEDGEFGSSGGTNAGQPTELALLVAAAKSGCKDPRAQYHRIQEIPFSSERKRMEVRARPVNGMHCCEAFINAKDFSKSSSWGRKRQSEDGTLYFVKGMPESVLGECIQYTTSEGKVVSLTEDDKMAVLNQSRRMAAFGLRVLAVSYGPSLECLTFAGLLGLEDPPRDGVADAVQQLRLGGVKVLMITGDSKETAIAIARRCGIVGDNLDDSDHSSGDDVLNTSFDSNDVGGGGGMEDALVQDFSSSQRDMEFGATLSLSGEEIDAIPPPALSEAILGVRVFYRVVPRHKLALVRALQNQGEIVAMTGDGVNDALSLKGADIGIAMGKGGTDVAKEASDVVLADDDFSTITKAIAEGKGIFFNIRNFLAFQLSTSFAALTMASVATAFGMPSPLNAMQILWINIIMDGPPAQSLGVEPVDEKILKAKPRKADDPILTRALLARAVSSAALIVYLTLKVFANELDDGNITRRDTTMTFMTFVNCDLLNAYVCRSSERCFYELDLFGNPAFLWAVGGSVVGQLLVIYFPPLQEVFQTEALSYLDLLYIICLSSSVLWLDTLRKTFFLNYFSDSYKTSPRSNKKQGGRTKSTGRMRSWLRMGRRQSSGSSKKSGGGPRNRGMLAL